MKLSIIYIFLISIGFISCQSKHSHKGHHHKFDDTKKWAKIFEAKKRDAWQEPEKVIKALKVKRNSKIADIGSATGYFPVRLARVANKGRVWGVDVEPNLVNYLNERAKTEKIDNLFSILGTYSDPLIPDKVDYIFMVNTYHHVSNRIEYFKNLKKSLTKNGQVVIIDFRKGKLPFGPKDKMKISKSNIIKEMKAAGYIVKSEHNFLKYQNIISFQ